MLFRSSSPESGARAAAGDRAPRASLFVRATENGVELPFSLVVIEHVRLGATLGEQGTATIDNIPPGTWVVRWQLVGYANVVRSLTFTPGRQETLRVVDPGRVRMVDEPDYFPPLKRRGPQLAHDLRHRLGVFFTRGDTCYLAAGTDSISRDALVQALLVDSTARMRPLRVVERVRSAGRRLDAVTIEEVSSLTLYRLRWVEPDEAIEGVGLGVVEPGATPSNEGGRLIGDLDGDGSPEIATTCTGQEGVNFLVHGAADRALHWHGYYYFGFDVEPTCTDEDADRR